MFHVEHLGPKDMGKHFDQAPETRLIKAIMAQAIDDCYSKDRNIYADARNWFKNEYGSFPIICDWLGWDVERARKRVLAVLEEHPTKRSLTRGMNVD